ncbi:carbon-nitrogen hydrolase family protein [Candidimonas sp. SYP-B2681]|uniref:carbon-nitrogen hydrolase family protein n=1 Tax=Candidimonas sp. SYP-B2681 TaxID=2497686 RepID=UPI000F8768A5|nr:carbon-nitrogen hydrolase family protein [Candidimonas sp. SYP-B2681]RTZ40924.1 carbon-nitrogen hydrolase family protein [Candidimonas sp. SYP-B2681]
MVMATIKESFRVAAIQTISSTQLQANLQDAGDLIARAVERGAELVVLPEYFCFMGRNDADKLGIKEQAGSGPIQEFLSGQAKHHGIWLVGGTLPLDNEDPGRIYNSTLVYGPSGDRVGRYDKIHLFGFKKGQESYDESVSIRAGENGPQTFMAPCGRVGLSICYDLRFPEFFRAMGEVNLIVLPAAFTYTTGSAHWEVLLRARAIENQCYVLASAQGGKHENGRRTWGHSVLIDPWGDVVDSVAEGPGVAIGDVNLQRLSDVRESLPALKHRTM